MSSSLNHTMKTAMSGVETAGEHAVGTAKNAMGSARESTMHTFTSTVSVLVRGVSAVSGLVTVLRSLDRDDGLAWFGLARRRSPLRSMAIFSAGVAMGAGAGLLFAPMAGADMRRGLFGRLEKAKPRVEPATSEGKPTNGAAGTTKAAEPQSGTG